MKDIRELSEGEITTWIEQSGYERYRARQLMKWLYNSGATRFIDMSDLPLSLREKLNTTFSLSRLKIEKQLKSLDGSVKVLYSCSAGKTESVIMKSSYGVTACLSVQVGCSMGCIFCATGYMGLLGNLKWYEILDQYIYGNEIAKYHYGDEITNVVLMGMGEPLANYYEVRRFLEVINKYCKIPMDKVTLSTVGIPQKIVRLADEGPHPRLAISLHSAIQPIREKIIPVAKSIPLEEIKKSILYYKDKTRMRVTLEYVLLSGINDDDTSIIKLGEFARETSCPVNLIEYNPIPYNTQLRKVPEERANKIILMLRDMMVFATYRRSKATDIQGGCGQLAIKESAKA